MNNLGNFPSGGKKKKIEHTSLKHLFWQILTFIIFCDNLRMTVLAKKLTDLRAENYYLVEA